MILLVAIVGAVVTCAPFFASNRINEQFGTWQALLAGTLTNVGTTILLAAVLFLLERTFTRHVTAAVAQTTRVEIAEQTRDLREQAGNLSMKVADLQRELDERRRSQASEHETSVDAVREVGSFESVADLLEEANSLRALRHGDVTVPAGSGLEAPRVSVYWGKWDKGRPRFSVDQLLAEQPLAIELAYDVPDDLKRDAWRPAEVRWTPGMSSADALGGLAAAMQASGYGAAAEKLAPHLFPNLADAIGAAMLARTAPAEAWMTGQLVEWLADGWAITDAGLESRDSPGISAAEFSAAPGSSQAVQRQAQGGFSAPVPPGVDPEFWKFAIERAQPHFNHDINSPVAAAFSAAMRMAFTTTTSPRRNPR